MKATVQGIMQEKDQPKPSDIILESGFWSGLWGENSVTDNPYDPCDYEFSLLVAM